MKTTILATGLALVFLACGVCGVAAGEVLLGSPDFRPSAEQPVGWRGDGSGSFPGATPPLTWSLTGDKGTNIIWKTALPFSSPASVIVVGDKLFVTGNPYYLFCVDKLTGKILWVRTVSPCDAVTAEERAANKEVFEKMDILAQKRERLLAKMSPATAPLGEIYRLVAELAGTDGEMMKLLAESDKVKYKSSDLGGEGGFMAATPASDGRLVYAWSGLGVTACFDLDGNRKWTRFDKLRPQEHGHYGSPLLVDDKVVIYIGWRYVALDKKSGKEIWTSEYHHPETAWYGYWYGSHLATSIGNEKVIVTGDGSLILAKNGQRFFKGKAMQATSPILCDNRVFWVSRESPYSYVLPSSTVTNAVPAPVIKGCALDYKASGFMSSSPLYHGGLTYIVGSNPILFVYDATNKLVYSNALVFAQQPPRGDRPYGCGICASPSFAGGKIFITGNFGTTLVLEPGMEYKEVGRNTIDQRFDYNYKTNMIEGTVSNPFFEGSRIYYRAQKYLYCIGEPGKK